MTQSGDTDLRGLAQILAGGWKTILFVVVALVGTVLNLDLIVRTPLYRSETTVLITPSSSETFAASLNDDSERAMRNELEIAESLPVLQVMEEAFGEDPYIGVSVEAGRDVLTFAATDADPEVAATMANTFASTFLEIREAAIIDDFLSTAEAVQARIDQVDVELGGLGVGAADQSTRDVLSAQRALLVQRLDDVALNSELARAGSARVVSEAIPGDDPVSPSPVRDSLVAAVAGLILGIGVVYLRSILTADDPRRVAVDQVLLGVPLLGEIPVAKGKPEELALAGLLRPQTPMVESYRTLRTAVEFLAGDTDGNVLQVISARPGDGKTTTASNLAIVLAENGHRTLLIDADIRNPTLSGHFGLVGSSFDLVHCVEGKQKLEDVVRELIDQPNLSIIPSEQRAVSGTAEMLSSRAFARFIAEVSALYDFVVIDSSPLLAVADGLSIAKLADAVLLAIGRDTQAADVERARKQLASVDVSLAGVIHNGVKVTSDEYGAYYGGKGAARRSGGAQLSFRSSTVVPARRTQAPVDLEIELDEWDQTAAPRRSLFETSVSDGD